MVFISVLPIPGFGAAGPPRPAVGSIVGPGTPDGGDGGVAPGGAAPAAPGIAFKHIVPHEYAAVPYSESAGIGLRAEATAARLFAPACFAALFAVSRLLRFAS
jgi:hypothetical protein